MGGGGGGGEGGSFHFSLHTVGREVVCGPVVTATGLGGGREVAVSKISVRAATFVVMSLNVLKMSG